MQPATARVVQAFEANHWFRSAGWMSTRSAENVLFVDGWAEAMRASAHPGWERAMRTTAAQMFEAVAAASPDLAAEWLPAVQRLQPVAADLVRRKADAVREREGLPDLFISSLGWMVLYALVEAEFSAVLPAGWYAACAAWILRGHLPCGWEGDWPAGKLVVL